MNKITISGRLTADPELRATNEGIEVCNFILAVDRRISDRNGDKLTDFPSFVAWRKTAVFVNKYFHKGDGINVVGRLESRKWVDKDGNNRVTWEIVCDEVEFPLSKPKSGTISAETIPESKDNNNFEDITGDEDELPF